eukprot:gnl/MRDRNA2_/MRDRNA2_92981_c0_seq1.p1 gnl/MRDRNA2_/MRDRNA2_92981_c0~~gnl/MRDRNA2_/MRDRNA2_92981_c0_seq1.p1  ORF type:complete len:808 (-),score=269.04 gnl/MRDRNA2_/MRDRNA2_92981_c0_seq1:387-2810(-)
MSPQVAKPSRSLTVSSRVEGRIVYYDIFAGPSGTSPQLKTTRFSELDQFHAAVMKEVPEFRGRLPPKTLKRHTRPAFVESRRADIELYLRIMATDRIVSECRAFKGFWEVQHPETLNQSSDITAASPEVVQVANVISKSKPQMDEDNDSEAEIASLNNTLNGELMEKLISHNNAIKEADKLKEQIQGTLASGEKDVQSAKAEAEATAAIEAEAAARIRTHKFSLEEQESLLMSKKAERADKEAEQHASATRLGEELAATSAATKAARGRYEQARRARLEADAVARSNLDAANQGVVSAAAASAAAAEHHQAMLAAMEALKERLVARKTEASAAEREKEARIGAAKVLKGEISAAEKAARMAEEEARISEEVLASHKGDSARRARAHEAEVRRAKEKAQATATLRDMRSRGEIMGEDRKGLEEAEKKAHSAAENMAEALAHAQERQKLTHEADEKRSKMLQTETDKAATSLKDRQRVLEAIKTRAAGSEELLQNASSVHAAALAKVQAIQTEYDTLKQTVEGTLMTTMNETQVKLESAKANVVSTRQKGEKIQTPLRHAEEAEAVVLRRHEATEASLVQALDAARTAAAEAHEDAGTEDHDEADINAGLEIDLLAASCKERRKDREQCARESEAEHKEALEALEAARKQLHKWKMSSSAGKAWDEYDEIAGENLTDRGTFIDEQPEARLEARVADLEQVVEEKAAKKKADAEAVEAARLELEALETQRRALPAVSLEKLIAMELKLTTDFYDAHKEKETKVLEEARKRALAWADERETLYANLHRTDLQIKVAKEDVAATKKLQQTLR